MNTTGHGGYADRLQKEVDDLQKEVEQLKDTLSDVRSDLKDVTEERDSLVRDNWPFCELTRAAQDYYRAIKEGADNRIVMVALESQLQRALEGNYV